MSEPNFWNDANASKPVVSELKALKSVIVPANNLARKVDDLCVLMDLAGEERDEAAFAEAVSEAGKIGAELDRLELRTLLSGENDARDCYFSIHAGAGGTESCDWAQMLYRMYLRYFERNGYDAVEVDRLDGEEAGIRSVTLHVTGPYAYGYLSCERGVHRLVRISPFDSQGRRHTSFASVDVLPELDDIDINIDWVKDIREDTYCSSGAGGQHVNKTASASPPDAPADRHRRAVPERAAASTRTAPRPERCSRPSSTRSSRPSATPTSPRSTATRARSPSATRYAPTCYIPTS